MRLQQRWWSVLVAAVLGRAGGRDGGGSSGGTVSPRAQHARGGHEVWPDPDGQWLHRLCDPPQCARWRHQRRALGLGRVRDRLRRPRGMECYERLKAKGPTGAAVFAVQHSARLCPDGAGHARQNPPALHRPWALGCRGWAGVSVCLQPPRATTGVRTRPRSASSANGPAAWPSSRAVKIAHVYKDDDYGRETIPILDTQAAQYGFTVQHLAVPPPGLDQKATWLRVKVAQPDWVILRAPAS